jgi:uncharacterized protein (DUF1499 family)
MWKWLAGLVAVAAIAAALTWPRINVVETGRTPDYPDLVPRSYAAPPERVVEVAEATVSELPRWSLQGSGSGPAGFALQAERRTRVFRFVDDVTIRVKPEGAGSHVSVRSASRVGQWDFGQNARNVRELLAALDARLD